VPEASLDINAVVSNDFNPTNNHITLSIAPAPYGTADLQVTNLEVVPSEGQSPYIVHAVITNAGPVGTQMLGQTQLTFVLTTPGRWDDYGISSNAAWQCGSANYGTEMSCSSSQRMAPGTSVSFEFELGQSASVQASLGSSGPLVTPDPNPTNNVRATGP
jgi:hypothetical protein